MRFLETHISEFPCTLVWFYRETAFLFALPFVYYGIIRFPIQGNVDWCRRIVFSHSFVSFLISSFSSGAERRIVKESLKEKNRKNTRCFVLYVDEPRGKKLIFSWYESRLVADVPFRVVCFPLYRIREIESDHRIRIYGEFSAQKAFSLVTLQKRNYHYQTITADASTLDILIIVSSVCLYIKLPSSWTKIEVSDWIVQWAR